jgi:hypothetical protein
MGTVTDMGTGSGNVTGFAGIPVALKLEVSASARGETEERDNTPLTADGNNVTKNISCNSCCVKRRCLQPIAMVLLN